MADIPPSSPTPPPGAEPMKKTTGKVAPKKETVSINLPSIMASMGATPAAPPTGAAPPTAPSAPPIAAPPMKKETGKVQPKKETVRINLPPKPSAAPTIKLPTLPPGGPTGAPTAPPPAKAPAPRAAAPAAAPRATAPAPQKPAPAPAGAPTIGTFDKILVYAAAAAALFAVGSTAFLQWGISTGN